MTRLLQHLLPVSFEQVAGAAGRECSADGEMIWTKNEFGEDQYSMCYAPSQVENSPGPTGGHLTCDAGSMFSVEAPKFCCHKPRMQGELTGNESTAAKGDLCADTLAEFDPSTQQFRITRGPTTDGNTANLASLQDTAIGSKAPSPLAFKGVKEGKEWQSVQQSKCQGHTGTLVKFKDDPDGKVEFCPTGTTPVRGNDYASWFCDSSYTKENRMHCCNVGGRLRCAKHLVDASNVQSCHCGGLGKGKETPESVVPTQQGMPLLIAPSCPSGCSGCQSTTKKPRRRGQSGPALIQRFL